MTKYYYNDNEVVALYKGDNLIYQISEVPQVARTLSGRFSRSGNFKIALNSSTQDYLLTLNDDYEFSIEVDLTSCYYMFNNLTALVEITHFPDTTYLTRTTGMFNGCSGLTDIHFDNLVMRHMTAYTNMFYGCSKLKNVSGNISGICKDMYLANSPLTNDSAMLFINALDEVTSTKTITFSSTTYSTLTSTQKAVATSKGWTVASA